MSEASEDVVEYWLNVVKNYFTMKNLKIKRNKEINFLAVTLGEPDRRLGSKVHVEVHVPAYSRAIKGSPEKPVWPPSEYAERIVRSKFEDPVVVSEVVRRLGEGYRKVAVWGSYGRNRPDREARKTLFEELERRNRNRIR